MPPNIAPAIALVTNNAFNTNAISVLEKPTSIMNGVNSFNANASPTLNNTTNKISATAPGLPSNSFSGINTDSLKERGGSCRYSGSGARNVPMQNNAITPASIKNANRQPAKSATTNATAEAIHAADR